MNDLAPFMVHDENISARDALLARLGSFLKRFTPRCGAWLKGWRPTDLARHPIIWEFRTGGEELKHFLLESLLDHVFQNAIEGGAVNAGLRLFVFVDDGQRLASAATASGPAGIDRAIAIFRSSGVGLGFLIQTPHSVSPYIMANTRIRVLGSMTDPDGWTTMARALELNSEQLQCAKSVLCPGRFIGRVTTGQWREPFLFEVPNVRLEPGVTDSEVSASQRPLEAIPVEFAEDFRRWEPHPLVELEDRAGGAALASAEQRLLAAVIDEPAKGVGHYAKRLAMNGKAARAARERLVQLGLLRPHRVQLTLKSKPSIVLEPTDAGRQATGSRGGDP